VHQNGAGNSAVFCLARSRQQRVQRAAMRLFPLGLPEWRPPFERSEPPLLWVHARTHPPPIVAERIGDDPALLLRAYAKRKNTADNSVSAVIGALVAGFLKA
jgi:hypothetical protein